MSENEQPEPSGKQPEPSGKQPEEAQGNKSARKGFSGWWLVLMFLLSMGSLSVSIYLAYELLYKVANSSEISELDVVRTGFNDLRASTDARFSEFSSHLESALERQETERVALKDDLARQVNEAVNSAPPGGREWKLAEIEYLLRIANHRLLLEEDVRGTIQLLTSADLILQEMDDFSLHGVRTRISEELQSLVHVNELDFQGLFLRIEALKTDIEFLPLRLPQYIGTEPETHSRVNSSTVESAPAQSGLRGFLDRIGNMFEFRTYPDEGFRPLLQPDEAAYLEMNLRLMLERAQLALLKRDAVLFNQSLESSKSWITKYLDTDNGKTKSMLAGIEYLLKVELAAELPGISASLNHLLKLRRSGPSGDKEDPS